VQRPRDQEIEYKITKKQNLQGDNDDKFHSDQLFSIKHLSQDLNINIKHKQHQDFTYKRIAYKAYSSYTKKVIKLNLKEFTCSYHYTKPKIHKIKILVHLWTQTNKAEKHF